MDLTIPSVPVTVKPGLQPAELEAWKQLETQDTSHQGEPQLSGLAQTRGRKMRSLQPPGWHIWFLQLLPALVFMGVWLCDQRLRYLEQHPEIVMRRRARRALRREWRALQRAARAGNAAHFVSYAANALRVACAPYYMAEPAALVGVDVLSLLKLSGLDAQALEAVRRIFTVADANRFSLKPADAAGLLSLEPELEHVLKQLEAKL